MIDMQNQTIAIDGVTENIVEWRVWFVTPSGLTTELTTDSIMPIPVAVGTTLFEPWLLQGVVDA